MISGNGNGIVTKGEKNIGASMFLCKPFLYAM
jgi:hypothetical protein